jgi:hypothetical protein
MVGGDHGALEKDKSTGVVTRQPVQALLCEDQYRIEATGIRYVLSLACKASLHLVRASKFRAGCDETGHREVLFEPA